MHKLTPYLWYPVLVGNALLLLALTRMADMPLPVTVYLPIVMTAGALFCLEWARPARRQWWPATRDLQGDSLYMLIVQIVLPRALMLLLAVRLEAAGARDLGPAWWPQAWPYAAQLLLMLLLADLLRYWLHRACHALPALWRLHEAHHAPRLLYTLNVGRFHPLEKCLHFALDTLPFVLLGVGPEVIAGYYVLYSVNGFFQHANVRLRYGGLNYLVASATAHRWHHAQGGAQGPCNFGSTLIVWDLLFGTFHLPRSQPRRIGIADASYPDDVLAQCLRPFGRLHVRSRLVQCLLGIVLRLRLAVAALRYSRLCVNPMRGQRRLLRRILHENRDSAFGQRYRFADLPDERAYTSQLPIHEYEALRPYVEAEIDSGKAMLTAARPRRYLQTSGTTGKPKLIPVTPAFEENLRQTQRLSAALQYRACPRAFDGALLVIAGAATESLLPDGRPIGAASGLLAGKLPWLLRDRLVLPAELSDIADAGLRQLLILRLALARRDLTLMATANVTTLLALLRLYREQRTQLLADLREGGFQREAELPARVREAVRARLAPDRARADELAALGAAPRIADLWPRLAAIATWTSGSAAVALGRLREELDPACRVLELGYLASEYRATLTLGRQSGSGLPNIDANFFEFVACADWDRGERRTLTLDGLRKGTDYYVIVTTVSGLYRYFINDIVRVTGFAWRMPLLRFVQKGKGVTSITGEKLYECQLLAAVQSAAAEHEVAPMFVYALANEITTAYEIYLECDGARPPALPLAAAIDAALCRQNLEYAAKRASGRLGAASLHWLRPGSFDALRRRAVDHGQRDAQFKIVALDYRARCPFDIDKYLATGGVQCTH